MSSVLRSAASNWGSARVALPQAGSPAIGSWAAHAFSTSVEDADEDEWDAPIYPPSQAFVGKAAPAFKGKAVVDGEITSISLDQYKGKFVVLFFYPKDFTFVCPTEIIAYSDRAKEFEALGAQLIAASTDTEETHLAWIKTPRNKGGLGYMQIPILADTTKVIAAKYGVLIPEAGIALRGIFIINPEGVLEQTTINNLPIGRSVDETLRLLQAVQYVREHGEVCPANWKPGAKTMHADPEKSQEYFSQLAVEPSSDESFSTKLEPITSKREFEAAIASDTPTVIDFYAPWCGKCRQIAPFVDELVAKHPGVKFYKFDTTAEPLEQLGTSLGVKGLPTFKMYKGGKEVHPPVIGYKKKPLGDAVASLA